MQKTKTITDLEKLERVMDELGLFIWNMTKPEIRQIVKTIDHYNGTTKIEIEGGLLFDREGRLIK